MADAGAPGVRRAADLDALATEVGCHLGRGGAKWSGPLPMEWELRCDRAAIDSCNITQSKGLKHPLSSSESSKHAQDAVLGTISPLKPALHLGDVKARGLTWLNNSPRQ